MQHAASPTSLGFDGTKAVRLCGDEDSESLGSLHPSANMPAPIQAAVSDETARDRHIFWRLVMAGRAHSQGALWGRAPWE